MSLDWSTMVNKAYDMLGATEKKSTLVLPKPEYEAMPTRIHWKNIKEYLKTINRSPEHFFKWLCSEIPDREVAWMSASIKDGLIVQGKRQKISDINDLSIKYINEFVTCSSCNSYNTTLGKEIDIKAWLFNCQTCGSTKYFE